MRRKSKFRKARVRWLADSSWRSISTGQRITGAGSQFGTIPLMSTATEPVPTALVPGNTSRSDVDSLILDHISGKVDWNIRGNGGNTGDVDAGGDWMFHIRMAIIIAPTATSSGLVGQTPILDGEGAVSPAEFLNPGGTIPWFLQGSWGPEGWRVLWRRSWTTLINFASGVGRDGVASCEESSPPAGYVDIKPNRILKANDNLLLAWYTTAIPFTDSGEGTCAIWYTQDLRVAAHGTQRRR